MTHAGVQCLFKKVRADNLHVLTDILWSEAA